MYVFMGCYLLCQDEDAKEKMFTLVQHIPVESFKGLQTETVKDHFSCGSVYHSE